MLVTWWVDLFSHGYVGAVFAVWLAATALPVVGLVVIASVDRGTAVLRRTPELLGLDRMPRQRLKGRLEESA